VHTGQISAKRASSPANGAAHKVAGRHGHRNRYHHQLPALEFGCDGVELWQWPRLLIE
jgi:hypothetical protein